MKKFFNEFKEFINKGNILDLAVAVVIGGAFGKIITSLVNDIIMPLFGAIVGKHNFSDLKIILKAATDTTAELSINYGSFLQSMIDFLIIAFFMFLAIKLLIASKKQLSSATEKFTDNFKKLNKNNKRLFKKQAKIDKLNNEIKVIDDVQLPTAENLSDNSDKLLSDEDKNLIDQPNKSDDKTETQTTNDYLKEIIQLLKNDKK